jgi:hypothetical protein
MANPTVQITTLNLNPVCPSGVVAPNAATTVQGMANYRLVNTGNTDAVVSIRITLSDSAGHSAQFFTNAEVIPAQSDVSDSHSLFFNAGYPTPGPISVTMQIVFSGDLVDTRSATCQFTVGAAPVIGSATTAGGKIGKPCSYQIKATNSPVTFGATGLPPGLSVNSSTGVISGTPAGAGTFSVQLSATNAAGTGTGTLALTVTTPVSGEPPAFVAPSARPAQAGFQPAWVPPPASPAPPPVPSAPPPAGAQPTLADLGRQLQEMSRQLAAFQAAWVPPPASPAPPAVPPAPPAGAQPTLADLGRQLQEMGPQLLGGAGGSRKTGIVAASGIVMQGLLTIQAMTEETGNPNAGGASRS